MESPLDAYVGLEEASARLGIHRDSLRRLIRQGKFPATKWRYRWIIRKDELEVFASHYDRRRGRPRQTLL